MRARAACPNRRDRPLREGAYSRIPSRNYVTLEKPAISKAATLAIARAVPLQVAIAP